MSVASSPSDTHYASVCRIMPNSITIKKLTNAAVCIAMLLYSFGFIVSYNAEAVVSFCGEDGRLYFFAGLAKFYGEYLLGFSLLWQGVYFRLTKGESNGVYFRLSVASYIIFVKIILLVILLVEIYLTSIDLSFDAEIIAETKKPHLHLTLEERSRISLLGAINQYLDQGGDVEYLMNCHRQCKTDPLTPI